MTSERPDDADVAPEVFAELVVPARDLKMIREALCLAQASFTGTRLYVRVPRLQQLVAAIDVHRPLGPDGKHGTRHTATCGCEL